jgi:hypothetical protein
MMNGDATFNSIHFLKAFLIFSYDPKFISKSMYNDHNFKL